MGGSVSSLGGSVGALAFDAAGNLYAGGRFLDMGGVFNTRNVAKWNGSAWNILGTGLNDFVNALVIGPAQEAYVGGNFTAVGDGSKVTAHFGVYDPRLVTAVRAGQAKPTQLVYPNPTTGLLTVRRPAGPATTATLYNSLGQAVRLLTLPTSETTVNLRGLPAGVYILQLTLNGQPISERVVVE